MTHDLFQINPALGAYASPINPAAINPLAAALGMSPAISPTAGMAPWGQQGYPGIGLQGQMHPQQQQLQALAAQLQAALYHQQLLAQTGLQNPYAAQQQNPYGQQQNPYAQQQNPYLQQVPYGQQNPFVNPIVAQQYGQPFGQYPQTGSPYGQVNPALAPQSWVGQPGQVGGVQVHPLVQQFIARQFQNPGFVPWAGI